MHMCEFLISHLICRKILCASGRKHWSVKSTTLYVSLYILLDSACFRNLNVTCSNTSLTRPHPLTMFIISMPLRIYQHTLVLLLLGFKSGCLDMLFFLCIKSSFLDVLHFSLLIFILLKWHHPLPTYIHCISRYYFFKHVGFLCSYFSSFCSFSSSLFWIWIHIISGTSLITLGSCSISVTRFSLTCPSLLAWFNAVPSFCFAPSVLHKYLINDSGMPGK